MTCLSFPLGKPGLAEWNHHMLNESQRFSSPPTSSCPIIISFLWRSFACFTNTILFHFLRPVLCPFSVTQGGTNEWLTDRDSESTPIWGNSSALFLKDYLKSIRQVTWPKQAVISHSIITDQVTTPEYSTVGYVIKSSRHVQSRLHYTVLLSLVCSFHFDRFEVSRDPPL